MAKSDEKVRPFRIEVPQKQLDELARRLDETRWPDGSPGAGGVRGSRSTTRASWPSTGAPSTTGTAHGGDIGSEVTYALGQIDSEHVVALHLTQLVFANVNARNANIVRWTELARGGHFIALEQPDILVGDLREAFRPYR